MYIYIYVLVFCEGGGPLPLCHYACPGAFARAESFGVGSLEGRQQGYAAV